MCVETCCSPVAREQEELRSENVMTSSLGEVIADSVEELISLVREDDGAISSIYIKPDPHNKKTHLIVFAGIYKHPENPLEGDVKYFPYAIYINKETLRTETDGF